MVTETTTQSWGSRVGGAFKNILIGILLVVGSISALFWNEGRTIKRTKALNEGASNVVSIDAGSVNADNEGKLVYLSGDAISNDELIDPYFNVAVNGIKFARKVEVFQWQENVDTKTERGSGGQEITTKTYSYKKVWQEGVIDSSSFKESGHINPDPSSIPIESTEYIAKNVKLGAFTLSDSLIHSINKSEKFVPVVPEETKIESSTVKPSEVEASDDDQEPGDLYQPAELEEEYQQEVVLEDSAEDSSSVRKIELNGFVLFNDYLYKGNPGNMQIGDIRVSYTYVPSPTKVSIVSQQQGDTFVPYQAKTGSVQLLNIGVVGVDQMFAKAQSDNKQLCWIIRIGGFVLMLLGFNVIFKPLAVVADIIPFASKIVGAGAGLISFCLSLCISLITIAVGWLSYRPLVSIPLLLLAGAVLCYPLFKSKKQSKA